MKAQSVAALSLTAGLCLVTRAQTPLILKSLPIDPTSSGDCKAIGDLDLDGKGDPIVGGWSLVWYESGASYTKHIIRTQPFYKEFTTDCQAADVDGDGDIDIIIGDGAGSANLVWYENPRINSPSGPIGNPRIGADWTMRTIGTHGSTVHDIECADLDNDGTLEVVSSGHGFTRIWKRSGTTWTQKDISSLAGSGIFIGDIDRDGKRDIATPRSWLKNPGDVINGTWTPYTIGSSTHDECLLVDLNRDGRLDLISCNAHTRDVSYYYLQPATNITSPWTQLTFDVFSGSHHPETADFNRDGNPDVIFGLELAEVSVFLIYPTNPLTAEKFIASPTGGHNARIGDINGDGLPDILTSDYIGNPPVSILLNRWCPANCDLSDGPSLLNVNDFMCFLNAFANGSTYANCDSSTRDPILNALDFQCFISRYAQGCP